MDKGTHRFIIMEKSMTPVLLITTIFIIMGMTAVTLVAMILSMKNKSDMKSSLRNLSLFLLLHMVFAFLYYYFEYNFRSAFLLKCLNVLSDAFYFGFIAAWLHTLAAFAPFSSHKPIINAKWTTLAIICYGILSEGIILFAGRYRGTDGSLYFDQEIIKDCVIALNALFALAVIFIGTASLFFALRSQDKGPYRNGELVLSGLLILYMLWILLFDFISVNEIKGTFFDRMVMDPIFVICFLLDMAILFFLFKKSPFEIVLNGPAPDREALIEAFASEFHLTKRETEVLACVCQGLNNPEIAEALFISDNTVKRHMNHIFQKTEVRSRYELMAKVME